MIDRRHVSLEEPSLRVAVESVDRRRAALTEPQLMVVVE
jgi:hypothetical protein